MDRHGNPAYPFWFHFGTPSVATPDRVGCALPMGEPVAITSAVAPGQPRFPYPHSICASFPHRVRILGNSSKTKVPEPQGG